MILSVAVAAGFVAGGIRAWRAKRSYRAPEVRALGWVLVAFLPQFVVFYLERTRGQLPDTWASLILVCTQAVLLIFVWQNRRLPGMWMLGLGLALNLLVIALNGGWMPIRPEAVRQIYPFTPEGSWQVGERLGSGKDVVLELQDTRLWFLSDYFVLPYWLYPVAFSLGDIWIAAGAFWLLWSFGGEDNLNQRRLYEFEPEQAL